MNSYAANTVSTAVVHVVGQTNTTGKTLVSAYRAGIHRLLDGAASLGQRDLPFLSASIKTRLVGAQQRVNGFLANRIDIDTSRVVAVMDRVATGATSGIESVAKAAAGVQSPMGQTMVKTLGSLHMPIASLSVELADRIAAGAKAIETRVAGKPVAEVARTVRAKAVRRAVRTARRG